MPKRNRLLFLCQTLPFPPDGGVTLRTYNILRILAQQYDITALCFYRVVDRRNSAEVDSSLAELSKLGRFEAFPIPQEHSRVRLVWDHLRSVLRQKAYTYYAYESREVSARLEELLSRESFDLVHLDSLDLAAYLPDVIHMPVVCVHHNVESELLRRRARAERHWWMRAYAALQGRLTRHLERAWCHRVALNVVVSEADRKTLSGLSPSAPVAIVPNGVDTDHFRPAPGGSEGVVFVGGLHGFANWDALDFFCREILPNIRSHIQNPTVRFVGRASESLVERYRVEHGVELTGYTRNIQPYVHPAGCYVVPLRVGGGTRVKILDAWAMGKAIVSTSIGCEGLAAEDGENILIRDNPADFAAAVVAVLTDETLRQRLGKAGRETAERRYSWSIIGRSMLRLYAECEPPGTRTQLDSEASRNRPQVV